MGMDRFLPVIVDFPFYADGFIEFVPPAGYTPQAGDLRRVFFYFSDLPAGGPVLLSVLVFTEAQQGQTGHLSLGYNPSRAVARKRRSPLRSPSRCRAALNGCIRPSQSICWSARRTSRRSQCSSSRWGQESASPLDLCQLGGPGLPPGWPLRRSGIQPSM